MNRQVLSDQDRVMLEALGQEIALARNQGLVTQAAHFAAQAYNLIHPNRPIEVPQIQVPEIILK